MTNFHINVIPTAISALIYFVIGGIWFSPAVFFEPWLSLIGRTRAELERDFSYFPLVWGALTAVALNVALAYLMGRLDVRSAVQGLATGGLVWLLIAAIVLNSYLFEGRSLRLFWLTMGYPLVGLMVCGAVLATWAITYR
jgi:uncharacterized protein DUF1761